MKEITGETIMIAWLKERNGKVFSNREIQLQLHGFMLANFPNNSHIPDSWSRYFRFVKDKNLLEREGLYIVPVTDERKFKGLKSWQVKEINELFELILE